MFITKKKVIIVSAPQKNPAIAEPFSFVTDITIEFIFIINAIHFICPQRPEEHYALLRDIFWFGFQVESYDYNSPQGGAFALVCSRSIVIS